jgi:hypothetical protein
VTSRAGIFDQCGNAALYRQDALSGRSLNTFLLTRRIGVAAARADAFRPIPLVLTRHSGNQRVISLITRT